MSSPMIGITCDYREGGGFSPFPWVAVGEKYLAAIRACDAIPLLIAPHENAGRDYLDKIDGLLITGGDFDIDPMLYGLSQVHETVKINNMRTRPELKILKEAMALDLPILGICGGEQLINVACGGTLYQHAPEEHENCLVHESSAMHPQGKSRDECAHHVSINKGTKLHQIVGVDAFGVNSAHHQAVRLPGEGVVVNASALDGLVEGIEVPSLRFCLGVQWHPEFNVNSYDRKIFEAFVEAARAKK